MVNLADTCCLDIEFDTKDNSIHYGEGVYPSLTNKITLKNLLPSLLNKSLLYPEIVYEEHKQVYHEQDRNILGTGVSFDMICLPTGLLGIEFIKTHIYYTPKDDAKGRYSTAVEVHYGILTVIMQKNKPKDDLEFDTTVEEGMVLKIRRGEKVAIPAGYYYTFINTEDEPVLFVRIFKDSGSLSYSFLKRENGLGYYCIRKNARQEIVHNPLYREIPPIREEKAGKHVKEMGIDLEESLYVQLRRDINLFKRELWG